MTSRGEHVANRLRELRRKKELSATDLAKLVEVSRQTIYAIEDGTFIPNTVTSLKLARALAVTVEEIFSLPARGTSGTLADTRLLSGYENSVPGRLVRVCDVHGYKTSIPVVPAGPYLPEAEGVITSVRQRKAAVSLACELSNSENRLLLAGCDIALSFLNTLLAPAGTEILTVPSSSRQALELLKKGEVHAAGSHLSDFKTGEFNVPFVRRQFPKEAMVVITFARWEVGLVVIHGNPKGIRSITDVCRRGVRIVNRESGAGSREVLDSALHQAGINGKAVDGYHSFASGHMQAAAAVASGSADCCIAPLAAARCFGLQFIPLAVHRFDLTLRKSTVELPAAQAMLDALNRSSLKRRLQTLAGYDTALTGQIAG